MTAVNFPFRDRRHAGRVLATYLEQYRGRGAAGARLGGCSPV